MVDDMYRYWQPIYWWRAAVYLVEKQLGYLSGKGFGSVCSSDSNFINFKQI